MQGMNPIFLKQSYDLLCDPTMFIENSMMRINMRFHWFAFKQNKSNTGSAGKFGEMIGNTLD